MPRPRILLYATASCPHCELARAAIRESGESWEERDPTSSPRVLRELLVAASSATVPTIVIGGRALVGFDQGRFEEMLRMRALDPPPNGAEFAEERADADPTLPKGEIVGGD